MNIKKQVFIVVLIVVAALVLPYVTNLSGKMKIETKNITVSKGDCAEIVLEENPSTGFAWIYDISDASVAVMENDEYIAPNSNLVGASGNHKFVIKGIKSGKAEILFKYVRSWEKDNVEKTIRYVIEVI